MTDKQLAEMVTVMTRIRAVEEALSQAWADGLIPGELHSGIGEEALYAGVLAHLGKDDTVASTHRSTGPFIGRGVDVTGLLLDCVGSSEGPAQGMAGHMHLMDPETGTISDGIVGSSAAYGIGQAIAHQHLRPGQVAVAFHGEGAMNQGMLLESYSLAVAWKLPVVFVCSDNNWSITTRSAAVTGGTPIGRAKAFGLTTLDVDGGDVLGVHAAAGELIDAARKGQPGFLHARTYRPAGHFEGDPLVRLLHHPLRSSAALAPGLLRNAFTRSAGSRRDRTTGAAELTQRIADAGQDHWPPSRKDPLDLAMARLDKPTGDAIRSQVTAEVTMALTTARAAVAGRTTNGHVVFGVTR